MHISRFMFGLYRLAIYLLFTIFYTVLIILDKKKFWAIFFFEFEMGCKTLVTTLSINNTCGPATANRYILRRWVKFCKGDRSLEDGDHSCWLCEVDNDQLRAIIKDNLLQLHEKSPKNSTWTIWRLLAFKIQWKDFFKKRSVSVSHELTKHFLNDHSKLFLLFCETIKSHLSIELWCVTKVDCNGYNQQHPARWLDWGKVQGTS